jgi:hypothetical protein
MKKNLISLAGVSLALLLCGTACLKDKSTEASIPLASIKLFADNTQTFPVGETVTFSPIIEWGKESESNYTFRWVLNGHQDISTEKDLTYAFTTVGEQYLNLIVTDKRSGLTYNQDYMVSITTPLFLGWMILSKGAGNATQLSFVHMDTHKLYPDVFASMHPGVTLGSGPIGLANHAVYKVDEILVMQENGGWLELDGQNLDIVSSVEEEFVSGSYPEEPGGFTPALVRYTHRGAEFVISKNGKVYDRVTGTATAAATPLQGYRYVSVPWFYKGYDDETKFTFATQYSGQYYVPMFDDANKRWIPFGVTASTPRNIVGMKWSGAKPSASFDYIAGMDEDVNLVYAQTFNEANYKIQLFTLLEKGGTVYADRATWTLASGTGIVTLTTYSQKAFPAGYTVTKDTPMWMMRGGGTATGYDTDPFLFFAQGSKLFLYHFPTGLVKLVRDFSAGSTRCSGTIVSMHQGNAIGTAAQLGVLTSDGHFYVLSMMRATATSLYQGNIDPDDPDGNGLEVAHVSGIPGEPLQVIFKYGKAANWNSSTAAY